MPRTYVSDWTEYGISRERKLELIHYCRQYSEWKAEAASLLGVGAQQYSTQPHGTDPGDPVGRAVIRREHLIAKCHFVEGIAERIDAGRWKAALIQNICMGKPLHCIDPVILPTSRRNEFYKHRRGFFILLNEELDKVDTPGGVNPL